MISLDAIFLGNDLTRISEIPASRSKNPAVCHFHPGYFALSTLCQLLINEPGYGQDGWELIDGPVAEHEEGHRLYRLGDVVVQQVRQLSQVAMTELIPRWEQRLHIPIIPEPPSSTELMNALHELSQFAKRAEMLNRDIYFAVLHH
ncbi:MAG TPA: hypothetical protein PKD64_17290 [Pirellulaceae bacterium]|nr:hypothetical protein [Pirellulaceae bacterium]HMO93943.1 hypothetical protein [Pirellulaceae bacterium]HMP69746.1 hypothetical protein [Pirellulaceae bacterium]